ncbi:MAG: enoyl-CoA hydratase/isomerase family protein [Ignavibacteriales bacterium]|nr:enoyl-CoA hydratase/isomerase family protein [Ignavibacteriales bacterium]
MAYETLVVIKQEGYALIQINRPQALNALNSQVLKELYQSLFDIDHDGTMHCSVITGNEKAFAAGADIKEMADKSEKQMAHDNQFAPFDHLRKIKKPIIAAVNGFALGGGCELVMACDIIIASETAKFGQPEINLGVIPGMGGTQRLTRAVGKYKAMELILTGDMFSSEEALKWGLVNKIVPSEFLLEESKSLAKKIASKAPVAVQAAKEMINKSANLDLDEALDGERQKFNSLFATEDQKEGMKAFIEKRKPVWKGM